ncbi:MAG: DNA recombination protein RmuC [Ruminococcus sp.]|nr:DNA recombination protein RmuC [Ruminococcus sp.]
MDIAILVCTIAVIILLIVLLIKSGNHDDNSCKELAEQLEKIRNENAINEREQRREITANIQSSVKSLGDMLIENQKSAFSAQTSRIEDMDKKISDKIGDMDKTVTDKQQASGEAIASQMKTLENRFKTLEANNEQKLEAMRGTISKQLNYIQEDNNKKLDQIRTTVDEKLQKTLEDKMNQSFKLVSERLEEVYKGLGEMQNLATGVGDLKKVLSNVKTRGILGEIQLGAILQEILTPEQYDTEVPTIPGSTNRVEFAVKLPGGTDGEHVYLPIDSKFPGDTYAALQDAYESGSAEAVKAAYKNLESIIKKCAKDIKEKYIAPPYTTNFAVMFLPFEGLYAEVVNHGLVEILQNEYKINIAGPSTMAAMLNSLQMGFKTLAIQKRSSEVWQVLGAVKTEFTTFEKVLNSAKDRIRKVDEDLDKLVGVRTRQINRKLRDVESLETDMSIKLIDTEE